MPRPCKRRPFLHELDAVGLTVEFGQTRLKQGVFPRPRRQRHRRNRCLWQRLVVTRHNDRTMLSAIRFRRHLRSADGSCTPSKRRTRASHLRAPVAKAASLRDQTAVASQTAPAEPSAVTETRASRPQWTPKTQLPPLRDAVTPTEVVATAGEKAQVVISVRELPRRLPRPRVPSRKRQPSRACKKSLRPKRPTPHIP